MRYLIALCLGLSSAGACELCAIYNAGNVVGESDRGFLLTVSEQFVPYRVTQFEGSEVNVAHPSYVDSSITHVVPGFDFSARFGLSLNLPVTHLDFRRTDLRYSLTAPPVVITEKGTEFGMGDTALIARVSLLRITEMQYGLIVNLLGGVKFPTGDSSRIDDEVAQARLFEGFLPPGAPHDPLGHSVTSVHQHQLALGSGSYDGVFGLTLNSRYDRGFLNAQFQYYLRTQGEADFKYGDELMLSGGPGYFLFLEKQWTLSLQGNLVYDFMERDELLGRPSNRTGSREWYLGPTLYASFGMHLSGNAGIDLPLHIDNNGFQSVPKYRLHAGITYRF
jgi:hypothetical protein